MLTLITSSTGLACQKPDSTTGKVEKVYDGDTIKVNGQKIRLLGINTPEIAWKKAGHRTQCYARKAKSYLSQKVLNKVVTLKYDTVADPKDRFDRRLAWVYLDKVNINAEIIKSGFGFAYRKYPNSLKNEMISLEDEAKKKNIGIWGACPISCKRGYCQVLDQK